MSFNPYSNGFFFLRRYCYRVRWDPGAVSILVLMDSFFLRLSVVIYWWHFSYVSIIVLMDSFFLLYYQKYTIYCLLFLTVTIFSISFLFIYYSLSSQQTIFPFKRCHFLYICFISYQTQNLDHNSSQCNSTSSFIKISTILYNSTNKTENQ